MVFLKSIQFIWIFNFIFIDLHNVISYKIFISIVITFFFLYFFKCLFWETEREGERERKRNSTSRGGAEKGGERKDPKQVPCCQHRAQHGAWTHEPWDHGVSKNQELDALLNEPPGNPYILNFLLYIFVLSIFQIKFPGGLLLLRIRLFNY